jgi:hypothetical protein
MRPLDGFQYDPRRVYSSGKDENMLPAHKHISIGCHVDQSERSDAFYDPSIVAIYTLYL